MQKLGAIIHQNRFLFGLLVVDILFFGLVSPDDHAALAIPAFVLLVITSWYICRGVMAYIGKITGVRRQIQRRLSIVLVATFALMIALQSVGQLTVRDVATLLPLVVIGYLYLSYVRSSSQQ